MHDACCDAGHQKFMVRSVEWRHRNREPGRVDTIYQRLSDQQLTVHCEQCNEGAKHKVMTILADKKVSCPSCAATIDVDTGMLERKIEAAQARRNAQRGSVTPLPG